MALFTRIPVKSLVAVLFFLLVASMVQSQMGSGLVWNKAGDGFFQVKFNQIVAVSLADGQQTTIVPREKLMEPGGTVPMHIQSFSFSEDYGKLLIFTNTKRVWRYHTRGDYWLFSQTTGSLVKLGRSLPASSLMFAKFSPDGSKVAYVSGHNLFVETLETGDIKQLTFDGSRQLINGTFDWVYEEEFFCRDGFRWSPDSRQIAYWQINAKDIKNYDMVNTTDSIYPTIIPVEYPVAGEPPSPYHIGVMDISTGHTKWMNIPTDPVWGSYVPRMEWAANSSQLIIQHLNRRQNESEVMLCEVTSGSCVPILTERDSAWIDILPEWDPKYYMGGWDWLNGGKSFLWASEKDGWRHLYQVSRDGKKQTLVTRGNFDVMEITRIDEKNNQVYYLASPDNATQRYLYRSHLDGTGMPQRITPVRQPGTHAYEISPGALFAFHRFSNYYTPPVSEWISLPAHQGLGGQHLVDDALAHADKSSLNLRFFRVKTSEGVEMDGWIQVPDNFDSTRKYPVLFYVYTEPWGQTVRDEYGVSEDEIPYLGSPAKDGYIYVSVDNRGTPVPKGRAWRKCVYRKIGLINIRDQALAATEILKWPYMDTSRVAVWGWSGGGSATLNLMFQYPGIYKTGIAIAAVGNQLTYDNVYQERYMGLPEENKQDFIDGSPITYAKHLQGNLLYIHGTGDDNVHYSNAEMLLNELIKYNKQFQFMPYPNRTHGISEGEGTRLHLATLFTEYLKSHCPPGPR
jgi:dipeptidyl-peptidase 4